MSVEIRVAVLAGVLSFAGAIGGTYLSSILEEQRNSQKYRAEERARIVEKRLDIIERCTTARSLIGRAHTLQSFQKAEELRLSRLTTVGKDLDAQAPKLFTTEMQKEYAGIQSMHFACVQMGSLLFGPKSFKAGKAAFDHPSGWLPETNNKQLNDFYDALVEEISYFQPQGSK